MFIPLSDPEKRLSATLRGIAQSVQGESITLGQLLALLGEQSLLVFCMILMIPFLLPVSIPGVSTVFSLVVLLAGTGVMLNRIPWLPNRLMTTSVATAHLVLALEKGARTFAYVDKVVRPRWLFLTHGATINRFNGFMLCVNGVLLLLPLGFVPFSNTLPGLTILLLCLGMVQRDGLCVVLSYLAFVLTVIYFGALFMGALLAGQGLSHLWKSSAAL